MGLQETWFIIITILWATFFVLEGFDFGVGMVAPFVGRGDEQRGMVKETIGPFWDGNEVWLITAGAATFAAFPDWYATMFSAFYIPLFLVVVALILRATGSEYRGRHESLRWRRNWDWTIAGCCLAVPLLIGVAFGGLVGGIPIDSSAEFTGSFVDLVQPFALFTGLTLAVLCLFQGLVFLRIKTRGVLADRASRGARRVGLVALVLLAVWIVWLQVVVDEGVIPGAAGWLALTFAGAAVWLVFEPGQKGWTFLCSSATMAFTLFHLFGTLYPDTMVSSTSSAYNLTIADSSGSYTLTMMTIVAVVMVPVVGIYTAWNYWVFRKRISGPPVGVEPVTSGEASA